MLPENNMSGELTSTVFAGLHHLQSVHLPGAAYNFANAFVSTCKHHFLLSLKPIAMVSWHATAITRTWLMHSRSFERFLHHLPCIGTIDDRGLKSNFLRLIEPLQCARELAQGCTKPMRPAPEHHARVSSHIADVAECKCNMHSASDDQLPACSGNFLQGTLPDELASTPGLVYLNLANNKMTGESPLFSVQQADFSCVHTASFQFITKSLSYDFDLASAGRPYTEISWHEKRYVHLDGPISPAAVPIRACRGAGINTALVNAAVTAVLAVLLSDVVKFGLASRRSRSSQGKRPAGGGSDGCSGRG